MMTVERILDCERCLDGIDVVLFDLDDTLYSEKEYVRSGYRAIARRFPQIDRMEQKLWEAFEKRLPAVDTVLENEGLLTSDRKEEALRIYRLHQPRISLYPGVEQLLCRLRDSKRLGLITDGRPEGQQAKLDALGIQPYFERVIITDLLGGAACRKPNPLSFQLMRDFFDVPYERMIYIGDNPNKDFIAPLALGMRACHFRNPDGLYC